MPPIGLPGEARGRAYASGLDLGLIGRRLVQRSVGEAEQRHRLQTGLAALAVLLTLAIDALNLGLAQRAGRSVLPDSMLIGRLNVYVESSTWPSPRRAASWVSTTKMRTPPSLKR